MEEGISGEQRRLSSSSRKAYVQQVNLTQGPAKRKKASTSLEFDEADLDRISLPHDDALMEISYDRVKPISSPLYGFTGASAPVRGIASLTVIVGEVPQQAVHTLNFLIVKVKSWYNRILGRIGLNKLQAVALTYHLVMKFPTPTGVGFVKGNQTLARRCYVASCRAEETLSINDQRDKKAIRRAEPIETLISIPLTEGDNEWQEYLALPPLLSKPVMGEDFFLYLAVAESAVNAVLVEEQDGQQFPVYYVSKVLQGAEQRYPNAEKLAFALLIAARKLRPYF
ncbi:hypothetical protein RJ639_014895 [Escallonia herrerae]|uniref:Reverse transcriptase/retrotransposon-derived protein RNase H-like domain-containing protein n=1 Tax=Escallonia herrerae TaxID=1293975 RepID=A0AA88VHS5_9ASTE|nr:hypothetical protein RJ639_014895 [Escallonia herrerae]